MHHVCSATELLPKHCVPSMQHCSTASCFVCSSRALRCGTGGSTSAATARVSAAMPPRAASRDGVLPEPGVAVGVAGRGTLPEAALKAGVLRGAAVRPVGVLSALAAPLTPPSRSCGAASRGTVSAPRGRTLRARNRARGSSTTAPCGSASTSRARFSRGAVQHANGATSATHKGAAMRKGAATHAAPPASAARPR